MSRGKRRFQEEVWRAERGLGEIEDLKTFVVLDPVVRLLRYFVDEIVDSEDVERLMREEYQKRMENLHSEKEVSKDGPEISSAAKARVDDIQAKAYL